MEFDLDDLKQRLARYDWHYKETAFQSLAVSKSGAIVAGCNTDEELLAWLDGYEYGRQQMAAHAKRQVDTVLKVLA